MKKAEKGRGAQINVKNKFLALNYEDDYFSFDEEPERTTYTAVFPKTILNEVKSPDLPMDYSMNPYQGCEHGCVYCYARVTHEYWGYGAGLDFERKIMVKPEAPDLLRKKFNSKTWKPAPVMLSGNTDCYQPIEREMKITRNLLKVFREFGNPVGILTKNALIERDLDILKELNRDGLVKVAMSITTLDEELRRVLEPRTSTSIRKLKAIERMSEAGIPVQIIIGPVIPALNAHEIPEIIKMSAEAGAQWAGYTMIRLNGPVATIFEDWLARHFPERSDKVLHQIMEINGGKLGMPGGTGRIRSSGNIAELIRQLMDVNRKRFMGKKEDPPFNLNAFCRPGQQLPLF